MARRLDWERCNRETNARRYGLEWSNNFTGEFDERLGCAIVGYAREGRSWVRVDDFVEVLCAGNSRRKDSVRRWMQRLTSACIVWDDVHRLTTTARVSIHQGEYVVLLNSEVRQEPTAA